MNRSIYVNVAVQDLAKSLEFYKALGFEQNLEFSNEDGVCMVIASNIYLMVLTEDFFKTFTNKDIADVTKTTETILTISADTKAEVDELADRAVALTGKPPKEADNELDFMYVRNFQDVDGHMWEVVYTDPSFGK
jgi:predicted lactoylglutathione lyase